MYYIYIDTHSLIAWLHLVIPYPKPRGLNTGVLLMNLTRMRKYGWEDKLLNIWFDAEKMQPRFTLTDQERINILLYFNPDLLFRLPCQFNYQGWFCNLKTCKSASTNGIQLIHGSGDQFSWPWVFKNVYIAYKNVNMTNFNYKTKDEFRFYIRNEYERIQNKLTSKESVKKFVRMCNSVLKRLL